MTDHLKAWLLGLYAAITLAALHHGATAIAMEPPEPAGGQHTAETKGLDLLKSLARSPVKNEDVIVPVNGYPSLGRADATLTLIEFNDLQCQYCRRHANSVLGVLLERYVDTGQLRYVFVDFPADARHPHAQGAAIAARCAAEQDALRRMRERLYASPDRLQRADLPEHARALGLNNDAFSRCLDDGAQADAVRRSTALGKQLMVRGTPTFLIGYRWGDGTQVRILRRIAGAQPLDVFEATINGVLPEAQSAIAAMK